MSTHVIFRDRQDAGRKLALRMRQHRDPSIVVLGLPCGGVPVAYEIAKMLGAPLDVCVVRKIRAPKRPELGLGAVTEGGVVHVDDARAERLGVPTNELARLIDEKESEVEERALRFRHGAPPIDVRGRTVILVDDGVVTGGTAHATIAMLRLRGARRIVLAVPAGAEDSIEQLKSVADQVVCLHSEPSFVAAGLWYANFTATTDSEVIALLDRARAEHEARSVNAHSFFGFRAWYAVIPLRRSAPR